MLPTRHYQLGGISLCRITNHRSSHRKIHHPIRIPRRRIFCFSFRSPASYTLHIRHRILLRSNTFENGSRYDHHSSSRWESSIRHSPCAEPFQIVPLSVAALHTEHDWREQNKEANGRRVQDTVDAPSKLAVESLCEPVDTEACC
jgi:hypothetical protein